VKGGTVAKKSKKEQSQVVRTGEREKVAVWLDHNQLAILRKWRDTEALNIAGFIRNAVDEAIDKRLK
jgi:hypothetical protein